MPDHPVRFPPPLGRTTRDRDGIVHPVVEEPYIECGQRVRLGGVLVECIRRAGHPVHIDYAHSNGYQEWCFDAPSEETPK